MTDTRGYWLTIMLAVVPVWLVAVLALVFAGEPTPVVGCAMGTPFGLAIAWAGRP